jgi:hypothetical protein
MQLTRPHPTPPPINEPFVLGSKTNENVKLWILLCFPGKSMKTSLLFWEYSNPVLVLKQTRERVSNDENQHANGQNMLRPISSSCMGLVFRTRPGVTGNNVPWNKCPGNNRFCCDDLNLRSLVYIAMHLNPSTNNKVGHFFQGDIHYCSYTCLVIS